MERQDTPNWQVSLTDPSVVVKDVEDIAQSIYLILSTIRGSDPLRPTFGSDVYRFLDRPMNEAKPMLVLEVFNAIGQWEHRIRALRVNVIQTGIDRKTIEIIGVLALTSVEVTITIPLYPDEEAIDTPVRVKSITLNKSELSLLVGETETLIATILPRSAPNRNIEWSSSAPTVATVDENGVIAAVSEGAVTITATAQDGGKTAVCNVTVTVAVESVTLNTNTASIPIGETETLIATVLPTNATNQNVTWSSSNPAVATVDRDGVVTGMSEGVATITVTTEDGGFTDSCATTVAGVRINGIVWATSNLDLSTESGFAANPQDAGMLFQWNRDVGLSSDDPFRRWNSTTKEWEIAPWTNTAQAGVNWVNQQMCPPGFRIPTLTEFNSLISAGSVWVDNWNGTGVSGRLFGTAPNQIFLPLSPTRSGFNGSIWRDIVGGLVSWYRVNFRAGQNTAGFENRAAGVPIVSTVFDNGTSACVLRLVRI